MNEEARGELVKAGARIHQALAKLNTVFFNDKVHEAKYLLLMAEDSIEQALQYMEEEEQVDAMDYQHEMENA